ncbi:MAG: hypothetical protein E7672_00740 [Ruminococcaceae bacterium]|nr:hypothetical protein [Oscillospiraceae bacterium]
MEVFLMKKLGLILALAMIMTTLVIVPAQATDAMGADLLASADLYLNFENDSYQDVTGHYNVVSEGDATITDGKYGSGINTWSGVNALAVEGLKFNNESFSIASWINVLEVSGDPVLYGNKDWGSGKNEGFLFIANGDQYHFNVNSVGKLERFDVKTSMSVSGEADPFGAWIYTVVVIDRAAAKYTLYVNGDPVAEQDLSSHGDAGYYDSVNDYTFHIGEDGTGMYNFGQTLIANFDEFAVFKSALTQEQVISLYTYAPEGYTAPTYTPIEMLDTTTPLVWTGDYNEIMAKADFYLNMWDGDCDPANEGDINLTAPFLDETGKWTVIPYVSANDLESSDPADGTPIKATTQYTNNIIPELGNSVYFEGQSRMVVPDYKFGTDSFTIMCWECVHLIGGSKAGYTDVQVFGTRDAVNDPDGAGFAYVQAIDRQFLNFDIPGEDESLAVKNDFLERATLGNIFKTYYHMAVTVDRTNNVAQFYINGRPYGGVIDISAHAGQSYDTEMPFTIGSTLNQLYKGWMDEFAIFKEVLTADEIASVYAYGAGLEPADAEPETPTAGAAVAVEAAKTETAISIDTAITEAVWGAPVATISKDTANAALINYNATAEDTTADVYFRWDNENLYVGMVSADANIAGSDDSWVGDGIQIRFIPGAEMKYEGFYDVYVTLNADGVTANGSDTAVQKNIVVEDGKINVMAVVPLSGIGVTAAEGTQISFNMLRISGTSDHSYAGWLTWGPFFGLGNANNEGVTSANVMTFVGAPVIDDNPPSAPQTFDVAVVAAIASVISLAGFAIAKKH